MGVVQRRLCHQDTIYHLVLRACFISRLILQKNSVFSNHSTKIYDHDAWEILNSWWIVGENLPSLPAHPVIAISEKKKSFQVFPCHFSLYFRIHWHVILPTLFSRASYMWKNDTIQKKKRKPKTAQLLIDGNLSARTSYFSGNIDFWTLNVCIFNCWISMTSCYRRILRTATAHHCSLESRDIPTESFLFFSVQVPFVLKWVKGHVHNPTKNLSVSFVFNSLDNLVQNPRPWQKLKTRQLCN